MALTSSHCISGVSQPVKVSPGGKADPARRQPLLPWERPEEGRRWLRCGCLPLGFPIHVWAVMGSTARSSHGPAPQHVQPLLSGVQVPRHLCRCGTTLEARLALALLFCAKHDISTQRGPHVSVAKEGPEKKRFCPWGPHPPMCKDSSLLGRSSDKSARARQ